MAFLYCSFCGKSQDEVAKLVAGPTVHICNECTNLCFKICNPSAYDPQKERRAIIDAIEDKIRDVRQRLNEITIGLPKLIHALDDVREDINRSRAPKTNSTAEIIGFGEPP